MAVTRDMSQGAWLGELNPAAKRPGAGGLQCCL